MEATGAAVRGARHQSFVGHAGHCATTESLVVHLHQYHCQEGFYPPPHPLFSLSLFSIISCLGLYHICALTVVPHDFGGSLTSLSGYEQSSKASPVRF